jgi:hypothetical protein
MLSNCVKSVRSDRSKPPARNVSPEIVELPPPEVPGPWFARRGAPQSAARMREGMRRFMECSCRSWTVSGREGVARSNRASPRNTSDHEGQEPRRRRRGLGAGRLDACCGDRGEARSRTFAWERRRAREDRDPGRDTRRRARLAAAVALERREHAHPGRRQSLGASRPAAARGPAVLGGSAAARVSGAGECGALDPARSRRGVEREERTQQARKHEDRDAARRDPAHRTSDPAGHAR